MKKDSIIIIFVLVLVILIPTIWFGIKTKSPLDIGMPTVEMKRMEHSIKSDNGDVVSITYFDKPVLSGESEVISKINEYFDTEYANWLNGKQDRLNFYHSNSMNLFLENVNSMRDSLGDDAIAKQPLQYTVDSEVIFLSEDIVSIKQSVYWFSGGPSDFNCFGSTFNLKTGDLLPFTYFNDINADEFRDSLTDYLIKSKIGSYMSDLEIEQQLGSNANHNFDYEDDGHRWNFAYEYYYDGTSICLTLNQISIHSGYIVKWNGRTGDQFEASIWRYNKKDDAFEEHQVYPVTTGVNPS